MSRTTSLALACAAVTLLAGCPKGSPDAKTGSSASPGRVQHVLGHYSFAIPSGWAQSKVWRTDLKESDLKVAPKKDETGFPRGVWISQVEWPAEGAQRSAITVKVIRFAPDSEIAKVIDSGGSIEKIVANERTCMTFWVPVALRSTFAPVTVGPFSCMRGKTSSGAEGEHVVGFRGRTSIEVEMGVETKGDAEGTAVAREGLDKVLATLEVE